MPPEPTAFNPTILGKSGLETRESTWAARVTTMHNIRDAAVRAERALEVLCEASESHAGHLLLADGSGLRWASSYGALSPGLELQQRAREFWEQRNSARQSETLWQDLVGVSFYPVLLTKRQGQQFCHVGVALISPPQNQPLAIEPGLLSEVSRILSV